MQRGQPRGIAIVLADDGSHVEGNDLAVVHDQASADDRMARAGRCAEHHRRDRIAQAARIGDVAEVEGEEVRRTCPAPARRYRSARARQRRRW
jgi:hypothetical protein